MKDSPLILKDTPGADLANTLLLRRVYRKPRTKAAPISRPQEEQKPAEPTQEETAWDGTAASSQQEQASASTATATAIPNASEATPAPRVDYGEVPIAPEPSKVHTGQDASPREAALRDINNQIAAAERFIGHLMAERHKLTSQGSPKPAAESPTTEKPAHGETYGTPGHRVLSEKSAKSGRWEGSALRPRSSVQASAEGARKVEQTGWPSVNYLHPEHLPAGDQNQYGVVPRDGVIRRGDFKDIHFTEITPEASDTSGGGPEQPQPLNMEDLSTIGLTGLDLNIAVRVFQNRSLKQIEKELRVSPRKFLQQWDKLLRDHQASDRDQLMQALRTKHDRAGEAGNRRNSESVAARVVGPNRPAEGQKVSLFWGKPIGLHEYDSNKTQVIPGAEAGNWLIITSDHHGNVKSAPVSEEVLARLRDLEEASRSAWTQADD